MEASLVVLEDLTASFVQVGHGLAFVHGGGVGWWWEGAQALDEGLEHGCGLWNGKQVGFPFH